MWPRTLQSGRFQRARRHTFVKNWWKKGPVGQVQTCQTHITFSWDEMAKICGRKKHIFRAGRFCLVNRVYTVMKIKIRHLLKRRCKATLNPVTLEVEDIDLHASVTCSGGKTPFADIQVNAFWTKNPPDNVNSLMAKTSWWGGTMFCTATESNKIPAQPPTPEQVHAGQLVVVLRVYSHLLWKRNLYFVVVPKQRR